MQSSKPICKLYYYEFPYLPDRNEWELTTDKRLAEKNLNHRVAELKDLHDYGAIGKIIVGKVLHIAEGFFEWNSEAVSDGFNTYGSYLVIDDVRECVLDRLEDVGLSDSSIYESFVGWQSWKIHSWLDLNEYSGILG